MRIFYKGVDITQSVDISACTYTDACGDRADLMDITFNRPQDWDTWGPQVDDEIRMTHELIDTGKMFVTGLEPEGNTFTIHASTMKRKTHEKRWKSWEDTTLSTIMSECADLCGMSWGLYGVDASTHYDYIMMDNESVPAFLRRILTREGAVLKCCSGKMIGIGVKYANGLTATQTMTMENRKDLQATWNRMPFAEWKSVTVAGYNGNGTATDTDVPDGDEQTMYISTDGDDMAQRYAAGILMNNNMLSETVEMNTMLNSGLTAMGRIDIESNTGMNSEWLVQQVTHDVCLGTSDITLMRCRKGVE